MDLLKLLRAKFGLFNFFRPGNPGLQPCQTHVWCGKTKKIIKLPLDSASDIRPNRYPFRMHTETGPSNCLLQIWSSQIWSRKLNQVNIFKCCYVKRQGWFKAVFVRKEICFFEDLVFIRTLRKKLGIILRESNLIWAIAYASKYGKCD